LLNSEQLPTDFWFSYSVGDREKSASWHTVCSGI